MKKESVLGNSKIGGIGYSALIFLYILLAFVLQGVIDSFIQSSSPLNTLLKGLISPLVITITLLGLIKYFNLSFKKSLQFKKFSPISLVVVVLVAFGMFFGLGFVNDLIVKGLQSIGVKPNGIALNMPNFLTYLAYVIVLAILPAIFEELFFRGFILSTLFNCGGVFSIVVSSLFFALYHGSLAQLVYQFIYGIFLGALAVQSKSVFPSIILHFINNFLVITFEYFSIYVNFYAVEIIALGIVLICFATIIFLLVQKGGKTIFEKSKQTASGKWALIYGVFGILFCLLLLIGGLIWLK